MPEVVVTHMPAESLEELLQSVDDPVEMFRNNDLADNQYIFPDEYTNWIEEQRAVRESCAIVDQSYHMQTLKIHGPDAIDFLAGLAVNDFEKFRTQDPPGAINLLMCNHDGYVIGDNICFHLEPNALYPVGSRLENNWIRYNAELTDLDVEATVLYGPFQDGEPDEFRFQIQGPEALDVMDTVIDGGRPGIGFFEMAEVEIGGVETYALGHGMAAMPGLEIFGPFEHHDAVYDSILEAGEPHGIRQMGAKAYKTGKIGSGWFVFAVPAIYESEAMRGYREWLPADSSAGMLSIGGSFEPEDITDYYMEPRERGQGHLIDFDHDFVGKDALAAHDEGKQRQRVTYVWNSEDVIDVFASLFEEGETDKFIPIPDTATRWSKIHYDTVRKDGDVVGFSKYPGYLYYEHEMLSLGTIDIEYSEPGTEVIFLWGEDTEKRGVERHRLREIRATVAPAPYVQGGRRSM